MKKYVICVSAVILTLLSNQPYAQTVKGPTTVLEKESLTKEINANNAGALGDSFDPVSGAVSFAVTDVNIPGNSSLKVELRRKATNSSNYENGLDELGGWSLDIPFIRGHYIDRNAYPSQLSVGASGWSAGKECSGDVTSVYASSPISGVSGEYIAAHVYWTGKFLHIPGETSQNIIVGTGIYAGKQVTTSNHYISSCFNRTDGAGEGIVVSAPNGNKYTFGYAVKIAAGMPPPISNSRFRRMLMVTKVQDKFGNYVDYNYESDRLKSIVASDGRRIDIAYSGNKIQTVSVNGRIWKYTYQSITKANGVVVTVLKDVTLPDLKKWTYSSGFYNQRRATTRRQRSISENAGLCSFMTYSGDPANKITFTVTTPEGANVEYTVDDIYHGSYDVHPHPYGSPVVAFDNVNCSIRQNLIRRAVSGPGLPESVWQYSYSQNTGKYRESVAEGKSANTFLAGSFAAPVFSSMPNSIPNMESVKTATILSPTSKIIYYIDRDADSPTQDKVLAEDYIQPATNKLLKRIEYTYEKSEQLGNYCQLLGHTFATEKCNIYSNQNDASYRKNNTHIKTYLYSTDGASSNYTMEYSQFDSYGYPQQFKGFNSFTNREMHTRQTYLHDLPNWNLGLPTTTSISEVLAGPYTEISRTSYIGKSVSNLYSDVKVPDKNYSYGALYLYFKEYFDDGNIKRIEQANSNRWTEYSNYKRGTAQIIATPMSDSFTPQYTYKEIDDNGRLTKITDPKGYIYHYVYDSVGRLTNISYGDPYWLPTKIEYLTATGLESIAGVVSGMLNQRITKGDYSKNVYFDALSRPLVIVEEDINDSGTKRYLSRKYDVNNNLIFDAYPSSTYGETTGIAYVYDALERNVAITQDSSNGKISSSIEYFSDNKIFEKDFKNNITTKQFLAYGQPNYEKILTITSPESVSTSLTYNVFGNPISITQGGITQYNVYDAQQQLCKEIRPGIGNKAIHYNITGEVDWSAHSDTISNITTECDYEVDANDKISNVYDNLGAIKTVSYGDGTSSKQFTYDKNGNISTLRHAGNNLTYSYDSLNNLRREKIEIPKNLGVSTRELRYAYNDMGYQSNILYPNNWGTHYELNALGQKKTILESSSYGIAPEHVVYAKDVKYYPSGEIDSFTYGNNLKYKMLQNSQLLPEVITTKNISNNTISGFVYKYDENSNVTKIIDSQNNTFNVSMTYDGLDRLKTADGSWGAGVFNYDALGNIISYNLGNFALAYTYDSSKRLTKVTGSKSYLFTYDERANVTSNSSLAGVMTYNLANQLRTAGSAYYTYDGFNRRVKSASGESIYSKSGVLMWANRGVSQTNYIYLGNRLIAKDKRSEGLTYVHTDHLGTVVAESDSSGQVTKRFHYKPFGESIEAQQDDVGYAAHKFDTSLGLVYMGARYYDPVIGRFYGNDPVGFTGRVDTFNRYSYVANNPYRYTDPKGMAKCGSNLKGQKCEEALNDADNARNAAESAASALKGIAGRAKDGKLTTADKAEMKALDAKGYNTSAGGLTKLANGLDKAASKIGERGSGLILKSNGNAPANEATRISFGIFNIHTGVKLNNDYFEQTDRSIREQIMLHEAVHNTGIYGDEYNKDGVNSLIGNDKAFWSNADTYACVPYATACGY